MKTFPRGGYRHIRRRVEFNRNSAFRLLAYLYCATMLLAHWIVCIHQCILCRDCLASCGEDGAFNKHDEYGCAHYIIQFTSPCASGTVVLWRMQPMLGDACSDPTDSHVIMRHIPHMCDVKDIRSVCGITNPQLAMCRPLHCVDFQSCKSHSRAAFALMKSGCWQAAAGASTTSKPPRLFVVHVVW